MLGYPSRVLGAELRHRARRVGGRPAARPSRPSASRVGESPNTALGTLPRGKGRITVFGAILPQAIESLVVDGERIETPHPFGLASYAVTITGGQVLDNVLAYTLARDAGTPGAGPGTGGDRAPASAAARAAAPAAAPAAAAWPPPASRCCPPRPAWRSRRLAAVVLRRRSAATAEPVTAG